MEECLLAQGKRAPGRTSNSWLRLTHGPGAEGLRSVASDVTRGIQCPSSGGHPATDRYTRLEAGHEAHADVNVWNRHLCRQGPGRGQWHRAKASTAMAGMSVRSGRTVSSATCVRGGRRGVKQGDPGRLPPASWEEHGLHTQRCREQPHLGVLAEHTQRAAPVALSLCEGQL